MTTEEKLKQLSSLFSPDQLDKLIEEGNKLKVDAERRCGNSNHYFYQTETTADEAPEYGLIIDGHKKPIVKNKLFWQALLSEPVRNKMMALVGEPQPEAENASKN